jgi:hypothetical protein
MQYWNKKQGWGNVLFHISQVMGQFYLWTCECKLWSNCQTNWEGSEQHLEKSNGKMTYKENYQYSIIFNLMFLSCVYFKCDHICFEKYYGFIIEPCLFVFTYEIWKNDHNPRI